jgi:hypothetical protein
LLYVVSPDFCQLFVPEAGRHVKKTIAASLTAEQISDAERKAAAWPKPTTKSSISSGHNGKAEKMSKSIPA